MRVFPACADHEERFPNARTDRRRVAQLELDARKVAVERNEEIVPRSRYGETVLASGDVLEIVHFIGGG